MARLVRRPTQLQNKLIIQADKVNPVGSSKANQGRWSETALGGGGGVEMDDPSTVL